MKKAELDSLREFCEQFWNTQSPAYHGIMQLLREAEPDHDQGPELSLHAFPIDDLHAELKRREEEAKRKAMTVDLEPVELEFDLEKLRARARSEKTSAMMMVPRGDFGKLIETIDRVVVAQHDLEHMGIDARQPDNKPFRHSHYSAGAHMLRRALDGKCVTPNGRTDGHGVYINMLEDGTTVCSFCKRVVAPPHPDFVPNKWSELECKDCGVGEGEDCRGVPGSKPPGARGSDSILLDGRKMVHATRYADGMPKRRGR